MVKRNIYKWKCGGRIISLGEQVRIMGILNVTPDSFSDGGDFSDQQAAVSRALLMVNEGADIIDIGGESTRPGATPVSVADEIKRTIPVIEQIRKRSDIPISIDTMKSEVAQAAIQVGADIINDVSGFEHDTQMARVAADTGAGVVLMHMKGTPRTMQDHPDYTHAALEILDYLKSRAAFAIKAGVARESICIDPGIGFGKTLDHNLELLRSIPDFLNSGYPVLIGASRKSMIGAMTGRKNPSDRLAGSLGIAGWSTLQGAHILRVHDVIDTCDVCRIVDTLNQ